MFDIEKLVNHMGGYYNFLYENDYHGVIISTYAGLFDKYSKSENAEFKNLLSEVCKKRFDFISSDREAASFMLAYFEQTDLKPTKKKSSPGKAAYSPRSLSALKWLLREGEKDPRDFLDRVYEVESNGEKYLMATDTFMAFFADPKMENEKCVFKRGTEEDWMGAKNLCKYTFDGETLVIPVPKLKEQIERMEELQTPLCESNRQKKDKLCIGFMVCDKHACFNSLRIKKSISFLGLGKNDEVHITFMKRDFTMRNPHNTLNDVWGAAKIWNPNTKNYVLLPTLRMGDSAIRKTLGW